MFDWHTVALLAGFPLAWVLWRSVLGTDWTDAREKEGWAFGGWVMGGLVTVMLVGYLVLG